jgi:hypothetical protein
MTSTSGNAANTVGKAKSDAIAAIAAVLGGTAALVVSLRTGDFVVLIAIGIVLPIAAFVLSRSVLAAATAVGALLIATSVICILRDHSIVDREIDRTLGAGRTSSSAIYPSLPVRIGDEIHYGGYLDSIRAPGTTIVYLTGPAGSGKSGIIREIAKESAANAVTATAFFALGGFRVNEERQRGPGEYGTQDGLGIVPELTGSGAEGLIGAVCQLQYARDASTELMNHWLFSIRKEAAVHMEFYERCNDALVAQSHGAVGLTLLFDDLDEIDTSSLLRIGRLVDREVTKDGTSERRLLIVLSGRPEFLLALEKLRNTIWMDAREHHAQVLSASIEPESSGTSQFLSYIQNCLQYMGVADDFATARKVKSLIVDGRHPFVAEASRYMDGCNYIAKRSKELLADKLEDQEFGREFYKYWRQRAVETHGLPPLDEEAEYDQKLRKAVADLTSETPPVFYERSKQILLYSGLIEIVPPDAGGLQYQLRLQFPLFSKMIEEDP